LCYLNYALVDQGIEELQQAAALLPERHTIRFELVLLHSVPGKYAAGLEQIGQAIKAEPGNRDYQYLQHYLAGMVAQARREYRSAVLAAITAYQLTPDARLAVDALTQFIAAHQAKLTQR
jgi:tetratricopeptide (TPR) repeat protein